MNQRIIPNTSEMYPDSAFCEPPTESGGCARIDELAQLLRHSITKDDWRRAGIDPLYRHLHEVYAEERRRLQEKRDRAAGSRFVDYGTISLGLSICETKADVLARFSRQERAEARALQPRLSYARNTAQIIDSRAKRCLAWYQTQPLDIAHSRTAAKIRWTAETTLQAYIDFNRAVEAKRFELAMDYALLLGQLGERLYALGFVDTAASGEERRDICREAGKVSGRKRRKDHGRIVEYVNARLREEPQIQKKMLYLEVRRQFDSAERTTRDIMNDAAASGRSPEWLKLRR